MRASLRPAALVLAAACVLLLLLAPPAQGDHAFSHRVVVEGRILDASGMPVPGIRPEVTLEGAAELGPCLEPQAPETGPTGDFLVCRHVHEINGTVFSTVRAGNVTGRVMIDPVTRAGVVKLRLDAPSETRDLAGERAFGHTLRVEGRVFARHDALQDVDGVRVIGTPRPNVTVEARLLAPGSVLTVGHGVTDAEGAYALDLEVVEVPAGARVQVVAEDDAATRIAETAFRRVDVDVIRDLRTMPLPTGQRPGSEVGEVPAPGAAWLLGAATAAALLMARAGAAARRPGRRGGAG